MTYAVHAYLTMYHQISISINFNINEYMLAVAGVYYTDEI